MAYTDYEYAEMAAQANAEGKILVVVDGELVLQDPEPVDPGTEPPGLTPEQIAQQQAQQFLLGFVSGFLSD